MLENNLRIQKKLDELAEASAGIPPRDNILYPYQEAFRDEIENVEAQIANTILAAMI